MVFRRQHEVVARNGLEKCCAGPEEDDEEIFVSSQRASTRDAFSDGRPGTPPAGFPNPRDPLLSDTKAAVALSYSIRQAWCQRSVWRNTCVIRFLPSHYRSFQALLPVALPVLS